MSYSSRLLSVSTTALLLAACFSVTLQAEEAGVFPIPEDAKTYKQLMEFVQEVGSLEPEGDGEQDLLAHRRKMARTVLAVTEQAKAMEIADDDEMECHYYHLLALNILQDLDEPQAKEKFVEAIDAARAHSNPDVAAVGIKFLVESGFRKWQNMDEQGKAKWLDSIADYVQGVKVSDEHQHLVITIVGFLSEAGEIQLAKQLLQEVSPVFRSSPDEQVQSMAAMLEGISRRLDLLGKKIELTGSLLDGSELDWASYRGKVVLVDFWATWCGPCRAEVPNMLDMYRAYHDKGFEVLGISLDSKAEEAEAYIEQTEIPWPTMLSKDESQRGWQHPMAVHYGVTGIPLAILVDREGTVVSMSARGEELGNQLRRILGEPVARTKTVKDALVQQVSNPASPE
ncbi:MAG: TlpA family protein disulfide reductase [Planctomycetes bacterium]|nr:TlpA family protein disulfide reductase [Planctomycetota bacterium]